MLLCWLLFTLGFTTRRFVWSWEFGGEGKKQVDVVISDINRSLLGDQVKIIDAIKEAGNVKRFFPSEFWNDVDRVHAVEPSKTVWSTKVKIRRAIEAQAIPDT